jgi:hypothetical protein
MLYLGNSRKTWCSLSEPVQDQKLHSNPPGGNARPRTTHWCNWWRYCCQGAWLIDIKGKLSSSLNRCLAVNILLRACMPFYHNSLWSSHTRTTTTCATSLRLKFSQFGCLSDFKYCHYYVFDCQILYGDGCIYHCNIWHVYYVWSKYHLISYCACIIKVVTNDIRLISLNNVSNI